MPLTCQWRISTLNSWRCPRPVKNSYAEILPAHIPNTTSSKARTAWDRKFCLMLWRWERRREQIRWKWRRCRAMKKRWFIKQIRKWTKSNFHTDYNNNKKRKFRGKKEVVHPKCKSVIIYCHSKPARLSSVDKKKKKFSRMLKLFFSIQ